MRTIIILLTSITLFCSSCQQKSPEDLFIDAEHESIMKIHDEVMPRLSDIHKLKKQLKNQENFEDQSIIEVLDAADEAMMSWMSNYDKPSASDEDYTTYLSDQKIKITQVSKMMLSAITQAEKILR